MGLCSNMFKNNFNISILIIDKVNTNIARKLFQMLLSVLINQILQINYFSSVDIQFHPLEPF